MTFIKPLRFPISLKKKYHIQKSASFGEDGGGYFDFEPKRTFSSTFIGQSLPKKRWRILMVSILLAFFVFVLRTMYLQIIEGHSYSILAEQNRTRVQKIIPPRGIIFDRFGTALVQNIPEFRILLNPLDIPKSKAKRADMFQQISTSLKIPLPEVQEKIAQSNEFSSEFIVLKENIPYEDALLLQIENSSLLWIVFDIQYKRNYLTQESHGNLQENTGDGPKQLGGTLSVPFESSLSHILGYVGRITETEYQQKLKWTYLPYDAIGKTGIEFMYEDFLRGEIGEKKIEVDALGREKKILTQQDPKAGDNIFLTIDLLAQIQLENIIKKYLAKYHKTRAVSIALNPENGEVLALVSLPAFDSNVFAKGISKEAYQQLLNNPETPLFNRAISGVYPSGSTIKPVIAAAALEAGIISPQTSILSTGGIRIQQWFFPDWSSTGHGKTNVYQALAWSVNTFFYTIAGGYQNFQGLGIENLRKYLAKLPIGTQTGIDFPWEAPGLLPSPEWKARTKQEPWYIGDTYHLSIGQGDILVTPIQVSAWTAFFANGGAMLRPHFLLQTGDFPSRGHSFPEKKPEETLPPVEISNGQTAKNDVQTKNIFSKSTIDVVREGLRDAVEWGSAQKLNTLPVPIAAKTGTAQWHAEKDPHSWLTLFAPFVNPTLVLTTLVEEGGEGGGIALDISKEFLEWYFSTRVIPLTQ